MVGGSNSTKRGSSETRKTLHSSFKPAPRLEQVGDEHSKRAQDRNHRSE
jgi:hypothetical protein